VLPKTEFEQLSRNDRASLLTALTAHARGVKQADHGLEQIIVTGDGCDPLNWEPCIVINEGGTSGG
jgi:hypothetical protein